jgi:hypothetical protein
LRLVLHQSFVGEEGEVLTMTIIEPCCPH